MDTLLALKPLLTTLAMPAASGLLFTAALWLWAWRRTANRRPSAMRLPLIGGLLTCVALWLLASPAVVLWLSQQLLPQVRATTPEALLRGKVQAIVVLGGGVDHQPPEYPAPNLPPESMARLLYGVYLSDHTQLPLAYSGGVGWGAPADQVPEAQVAAQVLARLHGPKLRWQEAQSRDTRENARMTAQLLHAQGITRVAVVTHAWHMPRSVRQFEAAGFEVTPAPMGFISADMEPLLRWVPSGTAVRECAWLLKEWLGLRLT